MLRQTFCHVRGLGPKTERRLWDAGIECWEDFAGPAAGGLIPRRAASWQPVIDESMRRLDAQDAAYFDQALPSSESWRMFREFRSSVAYLDIETTGMAAPPAPGLPGAPANSGGATDHITTIALYDGKTVRHYVHGDNLSQFPRDIGDYGLLVTYSGKCFDVPFIEGQFGMRLDQAHIDLRYPLRSLGYSGGLKHCEQRLGMSRGDLDGIDGFMAVLLWREYRRSQNPRTLETLLAYNIQDVLSLEPLMVFAYNAKLQQTPFSEQLRLPAPSPNRNPFEPDAQIVARLRRAMGEYEF